MRVPIRGFFAIAAAIVMVTGCASQPRATTGIRNLVTSAELSRAGDVNLLDALRQVRPTFLEGRNNKPGVQGVAAVQVYVDGLRMEGLDYLRQIMARNVKEVRFLEPQQANARFGGNNNGGALVVVLN